MFVEITHRGETMLLRRLSPSETLDPRHHADRWCAEREARRAEPNGHIPSGCAEYRCEMRSTKAPSVVIWDALDFFLESEEVTP